MLQSTAPVISASDIPKADHADNRARFTAWYEEYAPRLLRDINKHCCFNRHTAEEVCQEAWMKAIEKIDSFRSEEDFYPWLRRIAVNRAIDRHRYSTRGRVHQSLFADFVSHDREHRFSSESIVDSSVDPVDSDLLADEQRAQLELALDQLSSSQREVLLLRCRKGMLYREIAEATRSPLGTVKSRMNKATEEFRQYYLMMTSEE